MNLEITSYQGRNWACWPWRRWSLPWRFSGPWGAAGGWTTSMGEKPRFGFVPEDSVTQNGATWTEAGPWLWAQCQNLLSNRAASQRGERGLGRHELCPWEVRAESPSVLFLGDLLMAPVQASSAGENVGCAGVTEAVSGYPLFLEWPMPAGRGKYTGYPSLSKRRTRLDRS